jgi:hypothetical protein
MTNREIWLAAGCFWGAQKFFKMVDGVILTEVGFANGWKVNPTYKEVYTDGTGHAECVHICYDADKVPLRELIGLFLKSLKQFCIYFSFHTTKIRTNVMSDITKIPTNFIGKYTQIRTKKHHLKKHPAMISRQGGRASPSFSGRLLWEGPRAGCRASSAWDTCGGAPFLLQNRSRSRTRPGLSSAAQA